MCGYGACTEMGVNIVRGNPRHSLFGYYMYVILLIACQCEKLLVAKLLRQFKNINERLIFLSEHHFWQPHVYLINYYASLSAMSIQSGGLSLERASVM